jgi:hypothetical protein
MAPITRSMSAALGPDTLVKVLKKDLTHNGYTYKLGRNDCVQPFNEVECGDGGFYGCRLKDLLSWVSLYPTSTYVALVDVPNDARIKWFNTKFKTSSLVLTRLLPLLDAMNLALRHGADIHAQSDAALRDASFYGHFTVVQYLVEKGADVHANDDDALRTAARKGHLRVVEYLKSVA